MNKTLYITDLDGTLLGENTAVSEFTVKAINQLIRAGMKFTYATARSNKSSSELTRNLELEIPKIVYNGAFLIDTKDQTPLVQNVFDGKGVQEAIGIFKECRASPLVYSFIDGAERVTRVAGCENEGILHYINGREGDSRFRTVDNYEDLYEGDVYYFTCIGEKEEMTAIKEQFAGKAFCNVILQQEIYRPEYWCEIMPVKASKANAILQLKEMFGFERVVAFGDSFNDMSMFKVADECYATGNAVPELKAIATGVIGANHEDGVAKWLMEHVKS